MTKLLVTAATALCISGAAQASTLFFDDFESNNAALNTAPVGWSVSNGTVDIVGPGLFPQICSADGGHCIDLDGSTNDAGTMTSNASFALTAGVSFTLMFDYSWNYFNQGTPNTMTFGVGGFSTTLTTNGTRPASPTPYTPLSFSFVGDGSTGSIFFDHEGGDSGGIVIDNVSFASGGGVVVPPSTVPLPAGLPLIVAGLGALGLLRRRSART